MARPAVTVDDVIDLNCDNCARSVNGPMRGVGTGTPNSFLPDFGIHAGDQESGTESGFTRGLGWAGRWLKCLLRSMEQ